MEIKALKTLGEMRAAVDLQKSYWGDDVEAVVPAHMLFSLATHGGHVLAAMDETQMVGVLIGFLGTNTEETERPAMANLQMVSKRMVVLPEYRGQGIGYKLKLAQRDLSIKQGVRLVTWTFDPLLATNAHLNIRKLGAISHRYLEDYYGVAEAGGLATLGSSDRLAAEWWVTNRRVEERLNGTRGDLSLQHYLGANTTIVNPSGITSDGVVTPADMMITPTGAMALLEIPLRFSDMVGQNPPLARAWRGHTRTLFKRLMSQGYVVTDFVRAAHEGRERAFYLLSRMGTQFDQVDFSRN